jgi:hypothetical protein
MKFTNRLGRHLTPFFLTATALLALAGSGCIIDTGPDNGGYNGGGGGCYPNLIIDYEIQDAAGAPVTCAAAGGVTVQANVDGYLFTTPCLADASAGSLTVPLQGVGTYYVSINVFDGHSTALSSPQTSAFNITTCGDTETQTPAVFVVSPAASGGSTAHPDAGP